MDAEQRKSPSHERRVPLADEHQIPTASPKFQPDIEAQIEDEFRDKVSPVSNDIPIPHVEHDSLTAEGKILTGPNETA